MVTHNSTVWVEDVTQKPGESSVGSVGSGRTRACRRRLRPSRGTRRLCQRLTPEETHQAGRVCAEQTRGALGETKTPTLNGV